VPRKITLKAVQAQIRKLEARAEKLRQNEKPGIAELKAVIAKYKLAPADVKVAMKTSRAKGATRGLAKGSKLKPKYRNPADRTETWAGRGLKPKWLAGLIAKGKKLEDFAV
jgi:DNA-binding protein H-NS